MFEKHVCNGVFSAIRQTTLQCNQTDNTSVQSDRQHFSAIRQTTLQCNQTDNTSAHCSQQLRPQVAVPSAGVPGFKCSPSLAVTSRLTLDLLPNHVPGVMELVQRLVGLVSVCCNLVRLYVETSIQALQFAKPSQRFRP